jgi:hypothetical protein
MGTVTRIAKIHFGFRVRAWNEAADKWGFYNWEEVYLSFKSYDQICHSLLSMGLSSKVV